MTMDEAVVAEFEIGYEMGNGPGHVPDEYCEEVASLIRVCGIAAAALARGSAVEAESMLRGWLG